MKTPSERIFEDFCQQKGIRWKRVAEREVRTPDYDIFVPKRKIVVEVKEIEPNNEEKQVEKELMEKRVVVGSLVPGKRIQNKIVKANRQIKNRTKWRYPGILVLLDTGYVVNHLEPYLLRVAMYGREKLLVLVPSDPRQLPIIDGVKYGPKQSMTSQHNTSISAIGALDASDPDNIQLEVYHNAYASIPLDPSLLHRYGLRQFRLSEFKPGKKSDWEMIPEPIKL